MTMHFVLLPTTLVTSSYRTIWSPWVARTGSNINSRRIALHFVLDCAMPTSFRYRKQKSNFVKHNSGARLKTLGQSQYFYQDSKGSHESPDCSDTRSSLALCHRPFAWNAKPSHLYSLLRAWSTLARTNNNFTSHVSASNTLYIIHKSPMPVLDTGQFNAQQQLFR